MLRREDELNGRLACVELIGSDFDLSGGISEMVLPSGVFWYKNTWGIESYWSYHSQSAGRSGTGSINDFNGNLVYTIGDTATSGSRLPVSVNHVYNSSDRGTETRFGNGWTLNVKQSIEVSGLPPTGGIEFPYYYVDEDGTRHYLYKDGNVYKDEDGLGLEMQVLDPEDGEIKYVVTTKDKTVLRFDKWGDVYKRQVCHRAPGAKPAGAA